MTAPWPGPWGLGVHGELGEGQPVRVEGWVAAHRDLGKLVFLELADAVGTAQVVVTAPQLLASAKAVRVGAYVHVAGRSTRVVDRSQSARRWEVQVNELTVLSSPERDAPWSPPAQAHADLLRVRAQLARLGFVEVPANGAASATGHAALRLAQVYKVDEAFPMLSIRIYTPSLEALLRMAESVIAPISTGEKGPVPVRSWRDSRWETELTWRLVTSPWQVPSLVEAVPADAYLRAQRAADEQVQAAELWGPAGCLCVAFLILPTHASINDLERAPTLRARLEAAAQGPTEGHIVLAPGASDPHAPLAIASLVDVEARLAKRVLASLAPSPALVRAGAARATRQDVETAAALLDSFQARAVASMSADKPLSQLSLLLTGSAITVRQCELLLDLFPAQKTRILRMTPEDLYQWIWSMLGNDVVPTALERPETYGKVQRAIRLGVFTEPKQLLYFDTRAIDELDGLLERSEAVTAGLRRVIAECPHASASAVIALTQGALTHAGPTFEEALLCSARNWLASPSFLSTILRSPDPAQVVQQIMACLHQVGDLMLGQRAVDAGAFRAALEQVWPLGALPSDTEQLYVDAISFYYRPLNMNVQAVRRLLGEVGDTAAQFGAAGLTPDGPHWCAREQCYRVDGAFRLFPSKSAPSFFSKSTVGICTARDVSLYRRPDHFHFDIVAATEPVVMGNVQAHVATQQGAPVLLLRAVNVASGFVTDANAAMLVNSVIVAAIELALASGFAEVHLGEGMALWHLHSSRPEVCAVLEYYQARSPQVVLDTPLFLFSFAGIERFAKRTYRVWPFSDRAVGRDLITS